MNKKGKKDEQKIVINLSFPQKHFKEKNKNVLNKEDSKCISDDNQ